MCASRALLRPATNDPATGDRTTPNHLDMATGIQSGGPQGFGAGKLERTTVAASLSEYRPFLGADHEMKFGAQVEKGQNSGWTAFQGGVVSYTDNAGQPVQATFRQPATSGGEFVTTGLYAMDTVRFADRFTASLGLRFDHDRAISPDLPAHDAQGNETGATIHGLGTLYTWNVLSPRLGLTARLTADGRTMLRTTFGRFHQGILTGEPSAVHPGLTPTTTAAFDQATGQYSRIISVVNPTVNLRLDPHTRSPQTDQLGIGVERELARRLSIAASYVHKDGSDFIGWTDTGGIYEASTRTLQNGQVVPVQRAHERHRSTPLPADEPFRLLSALQRHGPDGREALVGRLAGAGVVYACQRPKVSSRRAARHRVKGSSAPRSAATRSAAIRTRSRTRSAGCLTIGLTCFV